MVALLGVLFALGAAVGLATQAIFIRVGVQDGRATDALVVVLLVDLVIFVPYAGLSYYPSYGVTTTSLVAFAVAGILAMMLGRAFLYAGIERIGASRAEPLKATQAVPAAILGILLLEEVATVGHLVGIALIVGGVGIISSESRESSVTDTRGDARLGILFVLASALCFGLDGVIAKIGFAEGTPVFVAVALKLLAGATGFFAYLGWRDDFPAVADLATTEAAWFAAAGVSSAVFLFSFYAGLAVAPVVVVVPVMQTSPLLVAAISLLFLQRLEQVTRRLVVGAATVVTGTVAVTIFG
ncbi:MAG: EamA family transporter [Halobacteriota archaeon]